MPKEMFGLGEKSLKEAMAISGTPKAYGNVVRCLIVVSRVSRRGLVDGESTKSICVVPYDNPLAVIVGTSNIILCRRTINASSIDIICLGSTSRMM